MRAGSFVLVLALVAAGPAERRRNPLKLSVFVFALAVAAGCVAPAALDPGATTLPTGFSTTHVFPGTYDTSGVVDGRFSRPLLEGVHAILDPEIVVLDSAVDGEPVEVVVFLPDVAEGTRVPVILHSSPYNAPFTSAQVAKDDWDNAYLVERYVPLGFAVAYHSVRGTAGSGGCMVLTGPAERADIDQAVTWLGEQPWSNGRVGMVGISYDGTTPWEAASFGNPYLRTIVPVSGINEYHQLMYKNGTTERQGLPDGDVFNYWSGNVEADLLGPDPTDALASGVCPEVVEGMRASAHAATVGTRDADGFWAERDSRVGVEASYNGSIFLVQGLQDWNVDPHNAYPWVSDLAKRGIVVKHMLGQWRHSFPDTNNEDFQRWDWAEIEYRWFDRWLRDNVSQDLGPVAQVQDSSGAWRSEAAWPPLDAQPLTFYLGEDAELLREPDPREAETPLAPLVPVGASLYPWMSDGATVCPGCTLFTTEALEEELRFAGLPRVHVTVVPGGPGGHVAAWLFVIDGETRTRVGWGQIDLRFAEGGVEPKPVSPGQPLVARMELEPLDVVVPKGARLGLMLHLGSYADHIPSTPTFPARLQVGGDKSVLVVDAFERGAEAFFEPPR